MKKISCLILLVIVVFFYGCEFLNSTNEWSNWEIEKIPTCYEDGYESRYRLINPVEKETRVIKAKHDFGEWIIQNDYKIRVCNNDNSHVETVKNEFVVSSYASIIEGVYGYSNCQVKISNVFEFKQWESTLQNLSSLCDEDYFKTNQLIMIFFSAPSGGDRFVVESFTNIDDTLSVEISKTVNGVTCDIGYWRVIIHSSYIYPSQAPIFLNGKKIPAIPKENWPKIFDPTSSIKITNSIDEIIRCIDNLIIETNEGYITLGFDYLKRKSAYIAKYDLNQDMIWKKYISVSDGFINEVVDLIEVEGGYLLKVNLEIDNFIEPYILKFSKDGELLWSKKSYLTSLYSYDFGFVGGLIENDALYLVLSNKDGNIISKYNISNQLNIKIKGLYSLVTYDNGFLLHLSTDSYMYNQMVCISLDGIVNWSVDIGSWNNNLILVTTNNIILLKLNSYIIYDFFGNMIEEKEFNIDLNHYHRSVSKVNDYYFVTGFYSDGDITNYLLGFDSYGNIIYEIPPHNGKDINCGITYTGIVGHKDGITILASYRFYNEDNITKIKFLNYDLFTQNYLVVDCS